MAMLPGTDYKKINIVTLRPPQGWLLEYGGVRTHLLWYADGKYLVPDFAAQDTFCNADSM